MANVLGNRSMRFSAGLPQVIGHMMAIARLHPGNPVQPVFEGGMKTLGPEMEMVFLTLEWECS